LVDGVLRGKQHMKLRCDELASWRRPEAFEQAMLGLAIDAISKITLSVIVGSAASQGI
jgi:hypothetical protein